MTSTLPAAGAADTPPVHPITILTDALREANATGHPAVAAAVLAVEHHLAALEDDCARVPRNVADYVAGKATLQDIHARDGRLTLSLNTDLQHVLAAGMVQMLGDAMNYVEMHLRDADGKEYILTAQRGERPTPHALRKMAEAQRDALEAELAQCRALATPTTPSRP